MRVEIAVTYFKALFRHCLNIVNNTTKISDMIVGNSTEIRSKHLLNINQQCYLSCYFMKQYVTHRLFQHQPSQRVTEVLGTWIQPQRICLVFSCPVLLSSFLCYLYRSLIKSSIVTLFWQANILKTESQEQVCRCVCYIRKQTQKQHLYLVTNDLFQTVAARRNKKVHVYNTRSYVPVNML